MVSFMAVPLAGIAAAFPDQARLMVAARINVPKADRMDFSPLTYRSRINPNLY
jgi:hypothetical protein